MPSANSAHVATLSTDLTGLLQLEASSAVVVGGELRPLDSSVLNHDEVLLWEPIPAEVQHVHHRLRDTGRDVRVELVDLSIAELHTREVVAVRAKLDLCGTGVRDWWD